MPAYEVPHGFERRSELRHLRVLASRCAVHLVNRRPGLEEGTTIGGIAADYAMVIEHEFDRPITVEGVSTGGSVAL
ncbi:MAG: hypothetical protein DYH08_06705 [Actinobacteria bacterium ATB1]|nr:hypothetical protein [Actinobacteria bacterium ATB1]